MYSEWGIPGVGVVWRSAGDAATHTLPADGSADLILRDDLLIVAGPSTRAFAAQGSDGGATLGIRFLPGLAGAALRLPADRVRDQQLEAEDALDPAVIRRGITALRRIRRLTEPNGADAWSPGGPDGATRTGLVGLPRLNREMARVVHLALGADLHDRLMERRWAERARQSAVRGESARELARILGYSERQLQRRMNAEFGYGVAALRRILRVERAQQLILAGHPLAEVAVACGWTDQAHLTREFARVAGLTPGRWAAARGVGGAVDSGATRDAASGLPPCVREPEL